jgi:hypothetical protein
MSGKSYDAIIQTCLDALRAFRLHRADEDIKPPLLLDAYGYQ